MKTVEQKIIDKFWLFWGVSPKGSIKYKKGKNVEQFLIQSIREVREETIREIMKTVDKNVNYDEAETGCEWGKSELIEWLNSLLKKK